MSGSESLAHPRATKRPARRVFPAVIAGVLGFALLASCNTTDNGNGNGDGGGSSGGSGGSTSSSGASGSGSGGRSSSGSGGSNGGSGGGSSGSADGGSSGGSGGSSGGSNGGSGGSSGGSSSGITDGGSSGSHADGGDGAVVCSNTDKTILPVDATGWVDRLCNVYQIQGAYYCFADTYGAPEDNCTKGVQPYSSGSPGPGMCLSGTVPASTSAYVGIGLSLNDSGGTSPVKSAYNATANNISGFAVTITGTTGGGELRVGFTGAAQQTNTALPSPFVSNAGPATTAPMTYNILLSQAQVPAAWNVANKGATVDPTAIYDMQIEIAGGTTSATYNFCVTGIKPISGDGGTPSTCATSYGKVCGSQDLVQGVGNYAVQNNIFNSGTGQCVQPSCSGGNAGFTVTFPNGSFGNGGTTSPSSYPSVIYGWANGTVYPGSTLPKQLSSITSANTSWQFSISGGTYDAAYDTWLASSATATTPGLELMIWPQWGGGVQPAGSNTNKNVTIGGTSWQVWTGSVNSWRYIAYRSNAQSSSVSFDLNGFLQDAQSENVGLASSWYLLGVQAGFEIYSGSGSPATSSFSVNVLP